jgi:thymidylate kinase
MRRGFVVALSGVDCAGKSTQRDALFEHLRAAGYEPVNLYTRAGYTPGLRALKRRWHALRGKKKRAREDAEGVSEHPSRFPRRAANLPNPLSRRIWLTTALLDLLLLHCVRIPWMRRRGVAVVCNRHLLDCLVDFRVNFPDDRVERGLLCRLLRRFAARPDAAFCLSIPADLTMQRSRAKNRFHWETLDVLERRFREYDSLARELGVEILDGTRPVGEISRSIQRALPVTLAAGELQHGRAP